MPGFNIESLIDFEPAKHLGFEPARYQCTNCFALMKIPLLVETKESRLREKRKLVRYCHFRYACPVCKADCTTVTTMEGGDDPTGSFKKPFGASRAKSELDLSLMARGFSLRLDRIDIIEHAKNLALGARAMRNDDPKYPPIRGLYNALRRAERFVHFVTYGEIPSILIGALRMTAQWVKVRGIVSLRDPSTMSQFTWNELTGYKEEAPDFSVKIFGPKTNRGPVPHQKLIVIDGLMAFEGSANLTLNGWRNAAIGFDRVRVETNIEEVIKLNNRYFSPFWIEPSLVLRYDHDEGSIEH